MSLVLPLQDEETTVDALLRSVAGQTRPPDEVVLVDAGSRDNTVSRAMALSLPMPLRVVSAERVFPGLARNLGVASAQGQWIAFTDGGIVLHPDWLRELLAAAVDDGTDVVFGNVDPICDSFLRECAAIAYVGPRDQNGIRGPSVASTLIRRSTFLATGGFPPYRAAEDLIFVARLRAARAGVAYAPRAQVHWQIAGSLGATFKRFATYSHHNLVAGWGRHWHLGVAQLYALLALGLLVAHLVAAGFLVWPALPLFFVVRAAKDAWVKRRSFVFSTLRPARVLGAAGILAVVDAATAVGLGRWLLARVRL